MFANVSSSFDSSAAIVPASLGVGKAPSPPPAQGGTAQSASFSTPSLISIQLGQDMLGTNLNHSLSPSPSPSPSFGQSLEGDIGLFAQPSGAPFTRTSQSQAQSGSQRVHKQNSDTMFGSPSRFTQQPPQPQNTNSFNAHTTFGAQPFYLESQPQSQSQSQLELPNVQAQPQSGFSGLQKAFSSQLQGQNSFNLELQLNFNQVLEEHNHKKVTHHQYSLTCPLVYFTILDQSHHHLFTVLNQTVLTLLIQYYLMGLV
jgi:hypothetical protein